MGDASVTEIKTYVKNVWCLINLDDGQLATTHLQTSDVDKLDNDFYWYTGKTLNWLKLLM